MQSHQSAAPAAAVTQTMTVTITVTPVVTQIRVGGSVAPTFSLPPVNANQVLGAIGVTTNPPNQPYTGLLALGGTDGAKFALSSPAMPSNLIVGTSDLPAGAYSITITASPASSG